MNLTSLVETISTVYRECAELWAQMGVYDDEAENRRQTFLNHTAECCQDYLAEQRQERADLERSNEELFNSIHDFSRQLAEPVEIPCVASLLEKQRLYRELFDGMRADLSQRKERATALVERLAYLTDSLDEVMTQSQMDELLPTDAYPRSLLQALENTVAEYEAKAAEPIRRMGEGVARICKICEVFGRDPAVHLASDSILAECMAGTLKPRHEQYVETKLQELRSEVRSRIQAVNALKEETACLMSLLQITPLEAAGAGVGAGAGMNSTAGSVGGSAVEAQRAASLGRQSSARLSFSGADAVAALTSTCDISDRALAMMGAELRRLRRLRLEQIPVITDALRRDVEAMRAALFGRKAAQTLAPLPADATEGAMNALEREMANLQAVARILEPMAPAVARHNELVAMQKELALIQKDTSRFTSKKPDAVRVRHREEELRKEMTNIYPKVMAALAVRLAQVRARLTPQMEELTHGLDIFGGRDYEAELRDFLARKDERTVRRFEMFLASFQKTRAEIDILKPRSGEVFEGVTKTPKRTVSFPRVDAAQVALMCECGVGKDKGFLAMLLRESGVCPEGTAGAVSNLVRSLGDSARMVKTPRSQHGGGTGQGHGGSIVGGAGSSARGHALDADLTISALLSSSKKGVGRSEGSRAATPARKFATQTPTASSTREHKPAARRQTPVGRVAQASSKLASSMRGSRGPERPIQKTGIIGAIKSVVSGLRGPGKSPAVMAKTQTFGQRGMRRPSAPAAGR